LGKLPVEQIPEGSGDAVQSVNGETGAVTLSAADVGAAPTVHAHPMTDVTGLSGALSGKADASHTHPTSAVTGLDTALADRPTTATVNAALADKSNVGHSHGWTEITGKPTTFTPATHTHAIADTTGLQAALDGKQAAGSYAPAVHTHAQSDITGLSTALSGKQATLPAGTASQFLRGSDKTFVAVTKEDVGLANVENTADLEKPISTATQAALDAKRDILVLATGAPIPGGTRTGSIIFRTA